MDAPAMISRKRFLQTAALASAHQVAMATYRRLERFFKRGTFFGIDETTHVHVDATRTAAVINCFNLEDHAVERSVKFNLTQVGLDAGSSYEVRGGSVQSTETRFAIDVEIPAYGHTLFELRRLDGRPGSAFTDQPHSS